MSDFTKEDLQDLQEIDRLTNKIESNLPAIRPKGAILKNYVAEMYVGSAERTFGESALVPKSQFKPYNPDDIWQKRSSYEIYEEMLNDEQVYVASQIKKDLVVGSGFQIKSDDDDQEEIVEFLKSALKEQTEISFEEQLEEILPYDFGFTIAEKIFKKREDGKVVLRKLKVPHPDSFILHTDEKGNMERYEQVGVNARSIDLDPRTIIHLINNRRHQNPYGRSDLRAAYNPWFVKRHIVRFYSIFLEWAASPKPVGKYDKDKVLKEDVDNVFTIIKKFQNRSAMMIPDDIDMSYLEAKSNGEAYVKGINLYNMFIGRALLIPDLMGLAGSETGGGSLSLGQTQVDIFAKHIMKRRASLERAINNHIIKPMVITNFGLMDNFPKFSLNPIDDETATKFAEIWVNAAKSNIYKPSDEEINHFRKTIKFPEGEVDRPEPPTSRGLPPGFNPGGGRPVIEEEVEVSEPGQQEAEVEVLGKGKKKAFEFKPEAFIETPGDYSKKVDFQVIENQLDSFKNRVVQRMKPLVDQAFESLAEQIEKKKIIQNKKVDRIDELKVRGLGKMKQLLKKELRDHYNLNQEIARNEVFKQNFALPLDSDEFLNLLEQETFTYIGDWEYNVRQKTRRLLVKALKDGQPLSAVLDTLGAENLLSDAFVDASELPKAQALQSIERFSRTKGTEVMNRGRLEFFQSTGVVSGYQYSAILDGRTTTICAGLHGKKFREGTQPVPPMHFNCRSVLVPITRFEEFEPDQQAGGRVEVRDPKNRSKKISKTIPKQDIDKFIEENKGAGFARS